MGELYTCKDVAERYGVQIITVYCTVQQDVHGGRYAGVQNAQQQQLGSHQGRQRCWAGCKLLVCWCHEVRDHQWQGGCDYDLQLES